MKPRTLVMSVILSGLIAGPAMAQNVHQYQGGPKSPVPHTMTKPPAAKTVEPKPAPRTYNAHRYQGGPSSSMPHRSQ
ncbi:hypothetical protein [Rhodoplanes azumiensis]|uniref:Uncharacterized protein n=1 Tax=Rhodoplanes azumiensis TaxID=1897628 RepID=A0ABW5AFV4_9BRAD